MWLELRSILRALLSFKFISEKRSQNLPLTWASALGLHVGLLGSQQARSLTEEQSVHQSQKRLEIPNTSSDFAQYEG